MFTGLVEEKGFVARVDAAPDGARLEVRSDLAKKLEAGGSIAVNGVCLTVVDVAGSEFTVDVVHETLARSSLAKVQVGDLVNLERATAVGDRLGGHIMQGHVDGTGVYLSRDAQGLTRFALPPGLSRYVVEKGSIAIDGVSLTVASIEQDEFTIALIPTTLELTTLGRAEPGDLVNIEVDVLAKYVAKLVSPHLPAGSEHNGTSAGTEEDA
jgi:riboflavin synthase